MKRVILIASAILMMLSTTAVAEKSFGGSFGSFSTATTDGMGDGKFLFGAGLGDNRTSFFGRFSYGLSKYTSGSLTLGLVDPDGVDTDTRISLGADFKYQFMMLDSVSNSPFDMATGAFFEYFDGDGGSLILIGGNLIGSYPFLMNNGSTLSPYGRMNVRLERLSGDGDSDSNLEFGLNMGVKWKATKTFNLYGEIQFDGNDGFFLGAEFDIM